MTYTRQQIEDLAPTIWDRDYAWGMVDELRPDPSMPKSKAQKNQGNTLWAYLADVRRAWDRAAVPIAERRALFLIGGLGLTHIAAAAYEREPRQTITSRYERAVGRLVDFLNGTDIQKQQDDEEENDTSD